MNLQKIQYFDPQAKCWLYGWLHGFTTKGHVIIEQCHAGVVVIPDWQIRSLDTVDYDEE